MESSAEKKPPRSGLRVLLVEDVEFNIEILQDFLAGQGWQCRTADSGEAALALLDEDRDFDVILMDIGLPGMDGMEASRRIRLRPGLAHLPILALTAEHAGERGELPAALFDGFLEKTFVWEQLREAILALLGRRKPGGAGTQPPEPGPVPAHLRTEILLKTYGDLQAIRLVARAFFADTATQMARLEEAARCGDRQAMRACCHSIRGAAAVFAAPPLAEAAARLHSVAPGEETGPALRHLQEEYETLRVFVAGWLAEHF